MDLHVATCPDKDTVFAHPPPPVIAETPMEVEEEVITPDLDVQDVELDPIASNDIPTTPDVQTVTFYF